MFFISFLLFIFIIFVYLFFKPYNYEKKYQIDEYNIYESYNKSNKNYEFLIRYNDITMPYMINSKYNGLSRGIYKKEGKGVNGVYNQDFNKNTILIEVGGEENTIDEVSNTCSILADILEEYIRG